MWHGFSSRTVGATRHGDSHVARNLTAQAFMELYRAQSQEFPAECREGDYERRLKLAYPIHPEVFERLYQDWSSLVKFQRFVNGSGESVL